MKKVLPLILLLAASCDREKLVGVAGVLSAEPEALDFGTLKVSQRAVRDVRIKNVGRRPLEASLRVEGEGFSLSQDRITLAPSESVAISIGFRSEAAGSFEGRLHAQSPDSSLELRLLATTELCGLRSGCIDFRFDESSNECVAFELADGTACSSICTYAGTCQSGACIGAPGFEALPCSDEDPCTQDRCDERLGCVHEPLDCDDGNACTRDYCDTGRCAHEDITSSCSTSDPCKTATCDAQLGCRIVPVADGTDCGPATCSDARVCMSGECVQSPGPAGTCGCDDARPVRTLSIGSGHTCRITTAKTLECIGDRFRLSGQLPVLSGV